MSDYNWRWDAYKSWQLAIKLKREELERKMQSDWADAEASRVWVSAAMAMTTTARNEVIATALRAAQDRGIQIAASCIDGMPDIDNGSYYADVIRGKAKG